MTSPKWVPIGKILISFATFCFIFPHALDDYGNEEAAKLESEAGTIPVV